MSDISKHIVFNSVENSVDIYLYGTIGSYDDGNKVDGDIVAAQIRDFDARGINIINEHINSDGGEITNGLSIVTANLNCKNSKVYTYNDGVAASMAGIIHQTGQKKFAAPYSQFMMHEPSICGETIDTTTDLIIKKRLQSAKDQLLSILFSSTGMEIAKLEEMLHQETWLNASDCEKMGFVTKGCVMSYPHKPTITNETTPKQILVLVNQAFNNLKHNQMAKTTCAKCGEKMDWEESKDSMTCPGCKSKINEKGEVITPEEKKKDETLVIENKANDALLGRVTSLENLVSGLKAENAALKAESEAGKKKITETLLDKAIEDGKIINDAKEPLFAQFGTNPEGLKVMLDFIPVMHRSIKDVIDSKDCTLPEGYKSLRDMEKKDPELAQRFALANPAIYDKLYNAEYK